MIIHSWTKLRLVTSAEESDACAALLWEAGCQGVEIDDSSVVLDQSEDAEIVPREKVTILGYLEAGPGLDTATAMLSEAIGRNAGSFSFSLEHLAAEDWESGWRQNFPPLTIGSFLIVPPWDDTASEDSQLTTIRIDPGLAFGTGQHPTTHMCLELLDEELSKHNPGVRLLDVGCGSGVLSIAASLRGASVTGSDLDAFCINATRDNALANGVEIEVIQAAGLDWVEQPFQLVVANLMSALLMALAGGLAAATEPGGTLIVSGISAPRALEVETALNLAGYATVQRRDMDGDQRGDFTERWTAFVFQRLITN